MTKRAFERIDAVVSVASNSYGIPTGYGVQAQYLIDKLVKHGAKVASLSNFGLEGDIQSIKTPHGRVAHYPKGLKPYSDDAIPVWHEHWKRQHPNLPDFLVTLYDVWVYNELKFDGPILAWTPLDHVSLSPRVEKFLLRNQVTPVAMAPHGVRQLEAAGIDCEYVPHSVDTKVFKPVSTIQGLPTREFMGVRDDQFLVGMVAANKANGLVHRKALAENIIAFAAFQADHPDAVLYLHMEPSNAYQGFNVPNLVRACGLDDKSVIIADSTQLRVGYPQETLAALYTAFDVLLAPSMGEGFGVPTVEAQACGTRVIGSAWAATPDLVADDGWLVQGQPWWSEPHAAWAQIPLVSSIAGALKLAYESGGGHSQVAQDFAQQFDVERVWAEHWLPLWKRLVP